MDWIHEEFELPMRSVANILHRDLAELSALGPSGVLWQQGVQAIADIASGARRLVRPQLVLLGHLGAAGRTGGEPVAAFAAGVELLHLFALIHDDVMDHGTLRRGVPCVHRVLRSALPPGRTEQAAHLAVLLGDLLHTRAVALMAQAGALPGGGAALSTILASACRAGVGQFLDLQGWEGPAAALPAADFRTVLLNKGGHHSITAPLLAGWQLADPHADLRALSDWGDHIGLAFQGLDDLQDVLSSPGELGKDSLQDLREGRLSLVGHLLREQLSDAEWDALVPELGRGVMLAGVRMRLFHLFARHDLVERGLRFVFAELDAARQCRAALPPCAALSSGLQEVESRLRTYTDRLRDLPRAL